MAVDKGYGSGKSRSAANSAARRRAAAGQLSKKKKGIASKIKAANTARANSPLGQIADTVLGFALPTGKVKAAAMGLRAAGKIELADVLGSRLAAKNIGKLRGKDIAQGLPGGLPKIGNYARGMSESVFPRGTDLAKRALKAKAETRTAIKESMNYQFPFNRVINESERIERKYGLNMRTAEEGLRQAAKRVKKNSGGR
jgi:hypothetical protein